MCSFQCNFAHGLFIIPQKQWVAFPCGNEGGIENGGLQKSGGENGFFLGQIK